MRRRPAYSPCRLFYDGARGLAPGHFLKTPGGSAYLVQSMRPSKSRPRRMYLDCLRWPIEEIPADAIVHPLHWYKRARRRARALSSFVGYP
jgi:hypothetical protein